MKYNLKPLILATLKERGKSRFNPFAADIETAMEPLVEETVRGQLDRVLKRVSSQALEGNDRQPNPSTENNHESTHPHQ